jgi:hypothetical protein
MPLAEAASAEAVSRSPELAEGKRVREVRFKKVGEKNESSRIQPSE